MEKLKEKSPVKYPVGITTFFILLSITLGSSLEFISLHSRTDKSTISYHWSTLQCTGFALSFIFFAIMFSVGLYLLEFIDNRKGYEYFLEKLPKILDELNQKNWFKSTDLKRVKTQEDDDKVIYKFIDIDIKFKDVEHEFLNITYDKKEQTVTTKIKQFIIKKYLLNEVTPIIKKIEAFVLEKENKEQFIMSVSNEEEKINTFEKIDIKEKFIDEKNVEKSKELVQRINELEQIIDEEDIENRYKLSAIAKDLNEIAETYEKLSRLEKENKKENVNEMLSLLNEELNKIAFVYEKGNTHRFEKVELMIANKYK